MGMWFVIEVGEVGFRWKLERGDVVDDSRGKRARVELSRCVPAIYTFYIHFAKRAL